MANLTTPSPHRTNQESLDLAVRKVDLIYQQNVTGIFAIAANATAYVYVGFAETLLRNPSLDEQSRRDVQSIYRQGNFMASLVNDPLDLSKIETNRL